MTRRRATTVTLSDVAREAGVSVATASRVLNGGPRRVRDDLRESVLRVAAELDYSANVPAQVMARGSSNVVGLVVHDIADPYFSTIAAGVMHAAEKHGLVVTIGSTQRRAEREPEYVATLRGQRVRAVILAGSRVEDDELHDRLARGLGDLESAGGRAVVIGQQRLPFDTVVLENRLGAQRLAESLVGLGHRSFAVLAGPRGLLTSEDRVQGFRAGLTSREVSLGQNRVWYTDFTRDGGYEGMARALEHGFRTGCVFAVNDIMAMGAIAACRDHGVPVPEQVAVAGFDDIATLRDVAPGLTTVRLPLETIGSTALDFAVAARPGRTRVKRVAGEVILRASTAMSS